MRSSGYARWTQLPKGLCHRFSAIPDCRPRSGLEIARYSTLITWATLLGRTDAAELPSANLEEEKATDQALSALGENGINDRAIEEIVEAA